MAAIATPRPRTYSASDFRQALSTAAQLVALYGDVYLPIFERVERELDAATKRELAMERAKRIAENV